MKQNAKKIMSYIWQTFLVTILILFIFMLWEGIGLIHELATYLVNLPIK